MMDEPNSHSEQPEHEADALDRDVPPELVALARRLSADSAEWQRRLPDPARVAGRIRAIPATAPHRQGESRQSMPAPVILPQEYSQNTPPARPPRRGRLSGLLAALAAVLIVGLLALLFAQQHGAFTTPAGHPTPTQPAPTSTPIAPTATATTAPTATATTPTGTWTTIQAYTGSGNYTSASFQVTSPWRLVWQCTLSMGNAGPYPLVVSVSSSSGSGGATQAIDTTCQTGHSSGTSAQETTPAGSVSLNINSAADGEWDVRVQVLR